MSRLNADRSLHHRILLHSNGLLFAHHTDRFPSYITDRVRLSKHESPLLVTVSPQKQLCCFQRRAVEDHYHLNLRQSRRPSIPSPLHHLPEEAPPLPSGPRIRSTLPEGSLLPRALTIYSSKSVSYHYYSCTHRNG